MFYKTSRFDRGASIVYASYMGRNVFRAYVLLGIGVAVVAQTPAPSRFVGTVTAIKIETAEIVVKPDNAPAVSAKLTSDTVVERVDPGAKDLKGAQAMQASDISVGDRVLVVLMPDVPVLRRIVDMSALDINKKNEADRLDWNKRGVSGVVAAKNGAEITLKMRSFQGETRATVTVTDKTKYKRYTPDSVKFVDAKISKLDEISVGDQVRTRGQKSDDGLKVTAEDVVFGTFVTKAGTVTTVNPESKEIRVNEIGTNKPLLIKLTADSQLKKMPNFGGAPGGPGGAAPGGAAPMGMRPGGAPPDLAQMIERMPPAKLEDLKPGDMVVVSSTKGAKSDEITAITLLANADTLIRMATMAAPAGARPQGAGGGPSLGGLSTGLDSLNLPGINP